MLMIWGIKKGMNIYDLIIRRVTRRPPDFVIGGHERPYLRRWFVIPRNRFFNIYLHQFLRSDDDRALHDHPWANCSIILDGSYFEHTIAEGGIHHKKEIKAGAVRIRLSGKFAHRIELRNGPCWTLFITGPRYRSWGFHCPEQGWVPWEKFTAPDDYGDIGQGCEG
jgi:hypothetical protein